MVGRPRAAVRLTSPTVLEVVDTPDPVAGPDEVIVRVAGAGLCHSDLHVLEMPFEVFPLPLTLGHEVSGHVESLGSEVTGWAVGTPVLVHLCWSCGTCKHCLEGRDNSCTAGGRASSPPAPGLGPQGGMAERIAVPARHLIELGDLDPVDAAPLADAGLTPYHAIAAERGRLGAGSTAVAIGIGGLGHMGLQILQAITEATVVAVDVDPAKLEIAGRLGIEHTILATDGAAAQILDRTGGIGADVVFDFVGNDATIALAVESVAPAGAIRLVGLGGGSLTYGTLGAGIPLPWGVEVTKAYGGTRDDAAQVIALAQAGKLHVEVERHPLEDAVAVFARLHRGEVQGRAVLVP